MYSVRGRCKYTTIEIKFGKTQYMAKYDSDICVGEFIRNCCVNVGIDPDTKEGFTSNVNVYFGQNDQIGNPNHEKRWNYHPNQTIESLPASDYLRFVLIS